MATITPMQNLTYGLLSNAAYKNGTVPPGWSIVDTSAQSMGTSTTGFAAVTFKNQSTGEIVISYRGTDEFGDASNNFVQLALQNDVPGQLIEAEAYLVQTREKFGVTPIVVGHSLGGALAQLVSAFNEAVSAFTYNAPGVYEIYKRELNIRSNGTTEPAAADSFTDINNTNMSLDAASDVGKQMGSMINYPPSSLEGLTFFGALMASFANPTIGVLIFGNSALGQHYMDRVLEAIATPKPTENINGYNFNKDTGNWERPSLDGSPPVPVDAETAASLNAQLAQNIQYNDQVNREVRPMLLQYRIWEEVTQQYTANNGQVWLAFDPNCDQYAVVRNTKGEPIATYEVVEENGKLLLKPVDGEGQTVNLTDGTVTGTGTLFNSLTKEIASLLEPTGAQTLSQAITTYGPNLIDALSLIKAIQSGAPLPVLASGLRLANDLSTLNGTVDLNLSAASNAASSILSILSLENALQRGDTLAAVTAGAQALSFGAQAYADFAFQQAVLTGDDVWMNAVGTSEAFSQSIGEAVPYLNLVNSIANGDEVGTAMAVLAMNPATAPIAIAYTVFNIVSSLFGDDDPPPEAWGNAWAGWSGFNAVTNASGDNGGQQTANDTYNGFISYLNQLAAYEQSVNPGSAIGIVANRLPSLSYRNYTGYQLTDIDPITGVQLNPEIKYDLSGRPYNAPPGSEQASQSLSERFIRVALARGAVAPMWEVQTAAIQTQYGDPQAGLTEEERAGRNGKLAAPVTGDTQAFRAVALDLNGDGVQTTGAARTVAFDVDDSGYLKNTAWLNNNDGFLFLDRNLNGSIDSGRELFSNSIVDLSARGLAGMRWIDSNYDGKLTAADPVWNELKIWQDANGDGQAEAGEEKSLSALGITALDYAMGRFEQNGQLKEMSSPDLAADTAGTRTHVVPEGIVVETTSGHTSLLVTRIDDRTVIEANRDGITSYEDMEAIVSTADLMANDALGGFLGNNLTVTGVSNFTHGTGCMDVNGFVHYTPVANYNGPASFNYTIQAPTGQTATATVDINLLNLNDAPTATVDQHLRAIYGYASQYQVNPESGGPTIPSNPQYAPYYGYDFSSSNYWQNYGYHNTPIAHDDPDGPGVGKIVPSDIDDPSGPFTYQVTAQPQKGSASIDASGNFQYTNWYGPDTAGTQPDGSVSTGDGMSTDTYSTQPDPFTIKVTDPHGASTTVQVDSVHSGAYNPNLGSGGGGKKPISIDLGNDGFAFTNVDDSNIFFDINGDGFKHRTAWPIADDGLLAYDANGDGKINSSAEVAFAAYAPGAQTDLEGLRAFDSNGDGLLTATDDKWAKFGVWQDTNQNGVTDPGEFRTLGDMDVASIALSSDGQFSIINGQTVHGVGTVNMTDGSTLSLADVTLKYTNDVLINAPDGTSQVVTKLPFSPSGEALNGTDGNDLILGKNGNNIIYAGAGNDIVFEDGGNDVIDGGDGNDMIYSGADNDLVMAGTGDDMVFAGLGNDMLLGGDGNDALFGEGGNDVIFGGKGNDLISGDSGNDVLSGDAGNDQVYGGSGNDALFGGVGDDELAGMDGNDLLNGGAGNDLLDGGAGADQMTGGAGDDIYVVDNAGDSVIENSGEGTDTVRASVNYTLAANVDNLTLTGIANLVGAGNELNNLLTGNIGNNTLYGGAGNDMLDGGMGADVMAGVAGDDLFIVDNVNDQVIENIGEGTDQVLSSVSHILSGNVENLNLIGTADVNGTGNALDNVIVGNSGNNTLDGGAGADIMCGGAGDDTYVVDNVGDQVIENVGEGNDTIYSNINYVLTLNTENLILTGASDLYGIGNELNNTITGNAGNNLLDGGSGADVMAGSAGDDTYIVDNVNDQVVENANEGIDQVVSSVSFALSDNVENVTLTGTDDLNGTGNTLDNVIVGNGGNNVLDGGTGADTMIGGAGSDIYIVDNAGDQTIELADSGIDVVLSSVSWALSCDVENLTLTGMNDINGTGNTFDNVIVGNSGNNVLDGGAGVDTMIGGAGSDAYIVDHVGDQTIELADSGIDTVRSSISWELVDNVENLTLTGMDDINGTGNTLDNVIVGNGGNNVLDGGAGVDTMIGGAGSDTYIVDNGADTVVENADVGTDLVFSSVTYALSDNVENLTLTGMNDINGTGNVLNNVIIGNSGNNILDGGAGADIMTGGLGNDTYVVDSASDQTIELAGGGIDDVLSSISWMLSDYVENLTLTGTADSDGTGNALDNVISGNAGNNHLYAGAGHDTLIGNGGSNYFDGSTGNDTLVGGSGNDTYVWRNGDGLDSISDVGGNDAVQFGDGLNLNNLALRVTTANGVSTAHVRALDDCGCEMDDQGFDFNVNIGADGKFVSPIEQFRLVDGTILHFDDLLIKTVVTNVSPQTRTLITGRNDDIIYAGPTMDTIHSGTGNDIVYAFAAKDTVYGEGGNDALLGGSGADTLDGGCGYNILAGGGGQDVLNTGNKNNLLLGGAGSDQIVAGSGNNFIAGGQQDDTITTGAGYNIIGFNRQDGRDTLRPSAGAHNALSLGGGLSYSDLGFTRSGNDLLLDASHGDNITIKDWYVSQDNHSIVTLQMIEEVSPDYAPSSSDSLRNSKVERFDFQKLVNCFDQARAANPNLAKWNLMNGLLDAHLESSDSAALGGEFAYEYGKTGSLAQVGIAAAETALKDAGFGGVQTLKPFQGLSGDIAIGL